MSLVGKIQVPGQIHAVPVTSTLFGRCSTAAEEQYKVVEIFNNAFDSIDNLMDGMTLKVFFEYGNLALNPLLRIQIPGSPNPTTIVDVPIMSFHIYEGEDHSDEIFSDLYTNVWYDGAVINFTFCRHSAATADGANIAAGDYWMIENQGLASACVYGYQGIGGPALDILYGKYSSGTLQACGYQNPNIRNGRYIYAMEGGSGAAPFKNPNSSTLREGIMEVISCPTIGASNEQNVKVKENNYIIENWTFYAEPGNIYRRFWSEPVRTGGEPVEWWNGAGWSPWYVITGTLCTGQT